MTKKRLTTKQFIHKAKMIHGDKYDYSETIYDHNTLPILIKCKEHGTFSQRANDHLAGKGCSKCARQRIINAAIKNKHIGKENLYEFLIKKFPNYKFSNFFNIYKENLRIEIDVSCEKHGIFRKRLRYLRYTKHFTICPICTKENLIKERKNNINKLQKILLEKYQEKYSYPYLNEEYQNNKSKITIICKEHGPFYSTFNWHISKSSGCPKCKGDICSQRLKLKKDDFFKIANEKYNNFYNYDLVDFESVHDKISINCPNHGTFIQRVGDHLWNCKIGCPKCTAGNSSTQNEIFNEIKSFYNGEILQNEKIFNNFEADIFLPELKLVIEYNGLYWHSLKFKTKSYHFDKRVNIESLGFRVINIWEDEWLYSKEKILNYLKYQILPVDKKIDARKCKIKIIDKNFAYSFLEKYHLLGIGDKQCQYIALTLNDDVLMVTGFKKGFSGWELHRNVTKSGLLIRGGFSKILKYWKLNNIGYELRSYIDLDKFTGGAYIKSGFRIENKKNMIMWYVKLEKNEYHRFSKFQFRIKNISKNGLTEKEYWESKSIYQIWNSGLMTVIL